jgi:hypothetical protein
MYHRQQLSIMGSGLGQSFFLVVTLSSGQVEWSVSSGSHSFKVHSCEQFRRIVRLEVDAEQTFLEGRLILSRIHLFSVKGMAQGGEWSRQLLLEGRLIRSRLHLVWCQRNGSGWGVVQAHKSGTVIP